MGACGIQQTRPRRGYLPKLLLASIAAWHALCKLPFSFVSQGLSLQRSRITRLAEATLEDGDVVPVMQQKTSEDGNSALASKRVLFVVADPNPYLSESSK